MGSSVGIWLKLHLHHFSDPSCSGISLDHQRTGSDFWDTNSITMSHVFSCDQDFPVLNQLWSPYWNKEKNPGWLTENWPEAFVQVSERWQCRNRAWGDITYKMLSGNSLQKPKASSIKDISCFFSLILFSLSNVGSINAFLLHFQGSYSTHILDFIPS